MARLQHPHSASFPLPPFSSRRNTSAIPATVFCHPLHSGLLRVSLPPRANNHYEPVLRCVRGCATSDTTILPDSPPPASRIIIKGLSRSTAEGSLAKVFSSFGEVRKVKIITSKSSKQSLGLAYIWFACEQEALQATKEMDGKFLDGRFITVKIADVETPSKQNNQEDVMKIYHEKPWAIYL